MFGIIKSQPESLVQDDEAVSTRQREFAADKLGGRQGTRAPPRWPEGDSWSASEAPHSTFNPLAGDEKNSVGLNQYFLESEIKKETLENTRPGLNVKTVSVPVSMNPIPSLHASFSPPVLPSLPLFYHHLPTYETFHLYVFHTILLPLPHRDIY